MKTMSMGGVSKKVMGLVVSIRIMDEATTAQLQDTSMVKHKKKTISTYLKNNQKRSVNYYPSNRLSKMCTQYLDFLSMLQLLFFSKTTKPVAEKHEDKVRTQNKFITCNSAY